MESYTSSKVPAAESILKILTLLSAQRRPIGAQEIAAALELPRSSVYHLLKVGANQGFIQHFPDEGKYGLGYRSAELSSVYLRQDPMVRLAAPLLTRMVDAARESGHMATLYGHETVYLLSERAARRPPLVTRVGVRLMAHATASGRAMLAALPEEQLDAVYASQRNIFDAVEVDEHTESTAERANNHRVAHLGELKQRLEQIRMLGYSEERFEVASGLASISAPVCDRNGWPVAAMTLTFDSEKGTSPRREEFVSLVKKYALALEKRLAM